MGFSRPTLPTLRDRAVGDIESRLQGTDAKLRRMVLNVLAMMHSGAVHGLYGYLDYLSLQLMPDTAEDAYLERLASIWDKPRKLADKTVGDIVFSGTDGSIIPAETLLQRADTIEYSVDSEAVIAAGSATVAVTAVLGGADGNTSAATSLSLVTPISGVNATATVDTGGLTSGADEEGDDALRARVLARMRQPPHGGAAFDYEAWALEVAGVTRVWVYEEYLGAGSVGVIFVCDDQAGSIIPDGATVTEVQAYIDALRPVTAQVIVFAPIPVDLDLTITLTPNTSVVQAAVEAELTDLLQREAEPGGTILLSHINEAISLAVGETDHVLTVPAADVVYASGELAVMGTITWL